MAETKKSKGERLTIFSLIVFIVIVLSGAFAGWSAQEMSAVQQHTSVLTSDTVPHYVYYVNSTGAYATSFALTNETATVTPGSATDILITGAKLGQFNAYAVNKLTVYLSGVDIATKNATGATVYKSMTGNMTIVFGYGTTAASFTPAYAAKVPLNGTIDYNIPVSPAMLTGPQNDTVMVKLEFPSEPATSYKVMLTASGVSSGVFNYTTAEYVAEVAAGIIALVGVFLMLPFHDISIKTMKAKGVSVPYAGRKAGSGGRKRGKR
ncbi:hypothetical protein DMB44_05405 [Thermoplasma sp. Kam2015]|uniref:hypothetical protein n=1 Tax=Thermoplasma sp. Kam2015 TaxID=2094122 RepID=UPI000D84B7FB|nr:hypothetical protein [Thermoplasma sp. Kam2015]PYB68158.1 hypothetical protein DMB44_05405 [Thermoplasma sp. Kam2015]